VQSDLKHFPFKVINKQAKPYIVVQYRGEEKEFVSRRAYSRSFVGSLTSWCHLVPGGSVLNGSH
jgi:hypothetical protein